MGKTKEIFKHGDIVQYSETGKKILDRLKKPHRIGVFVRYQTVSEEVCMIKWSGTQTPEGIHYTFISKYSI